MHLSGLLVLLAAKGLDMQVALRPFSCGWGLLDSSNRQQEQKNLSAYVNNNSYAIYEELGDAPMLVMGPWPVRQGSMVCAVVPFAPWVPALQAWPFLLFPSVRPVQLACTLARWASPPVPTALPELMRMGRAAACARAVLQATTRP